MEPRPPERAREGPKRARSERASEPERSRSRPRRRRGSSSRTGRAPRRWPPPPRRRGPGSHREAGRAPAPGPHRELPTPAESARGRRPRARRWPSGSRSAPLAAGPRGRARRRGGGASAPPRAQGPPGSGRTEGGGKMAAARKGRSSALLSSVPLQIQFYVSGIYYLFYFLISLLATFYKTHLYPYPPNFWTIEMILLWSMGILEVLRLYLGSPACPPTPLPRCKGQLDGRGGPVGQQLPADHHQRQPVSVLPAVGQLCAED
ncbi:transmembrane protein 80 isoform X2 [Macrotis lagotis]|uniref:transmembrane protein 80 isoform X2 n=1 Tax=Macrotis lagotis TaxID=92651 RepID=UPI003D6868B8